jgi:polysaccharide export outer membrane protein
MVLGLSGVFGSVLLQAVVAQGQPLAQRQAFPIPDSAPMTVPSPAEALRTTDLSLPGRARPSLNSSPVPAAPVGALPVAVSFPDRSYRYRLGSGDRLRMSVFKVEGYEALVEVLSDGTVNLPRLNSVPVAGLTLDEAQRRLTKLYSRYLRRPLVYLDLVAPRPVRVTVVGEVQKPGFYSISPEPRQSTLGNVGAGQTAVTSSGWPTLVDAVQRAGGITGIADLSRVILVRRSAEMMSPQTVYQFDFLSALTGQGRTTNPLLFDGDTIEVARLEIEIPNNILLKTGKSNLSAESIAVTVVGEVNVPGLKQVRSNSSLTEAVMAAGDLNQLRADANYIRLLRMQSDGTVLSSRLRLEPGAPLGSQNNPVLQNGDVIVVARNGWTSFNQRLSQAVEPLGPLLNAASLYNILRQGP